MSTRRAGTLIAALLLMLAVAVPDALASETLPGQLQGVNRSGTEYACVQGWGVFDGPVDDRAISAMADWGVNTVRVPLNESCWLGLAGVPSEFSGEVYRRALTGFVDRLLAAGMTVILDLHWSSGNGPARGQDPMPNMTHSPNFWGQVATVFSHRDGVVFEAFNEPHSVGWECWRDGCDGWAGVQDLVDAIRGAGASQPIILTGLEWGNDLRGWLEHRPTDPQDALVAGAHVYDFNRCSDPECWDRELGPVAAAVPLVITEFGSSDCSRAWAESLMKWADAHGVSYLAWSWNTADCRSGPALIDSYGGTPTEYGEAVRRHFASGRFVDDDGSVHEAAIEWLAAAGVSRGCNPPINDRFCPDQPLTREQSAAFFSRVFGLAAGPPHRFSDSLGSPFAPEIGGMAMAGISRGCDPPGNRRFCPTDPITRGQWAAFVVRALDLDRSGAANGFNDTAGHVFESDIAALAQSGLTSGCNPPRSDRFCAEEPVTRAQAASFFARISSLIGR
jgi:endoglucanase